MHNIVVVVVAVSLFSNNVQSKIKKKILHDHIYTWMKPDDTLLAVAREPKLIELATVDMNRQCQLGGFGIAHGYISEVPE